MDRSFRLISPLERAFHVKNLGGLRDMPPADLASIALLADEHSFSRGEALCRPGERVERVHIVVDGLVGSAAASTATKSSAPGTGSACSACSRATTTGLTPSPRATL